METISNYTTQVSTYTKTFPPHNAVAAVFIYAFTFIFLFLILLSVLSLLLTPVVVADLAPAVYFCCCCWYLPCFMPLAIVIVFTFLLIPFPLLFIILLIITFFHYWILWINSRYVMHDVDVIQIA